jgi:hypothetical protein
MNEALHFIFTKVDSSHRIINGLNQFWVSIEQKNDEQILDELWDEWTRLVERVGDDRASLQLMTLSALAPLLNDDSFVPAENRVQAIRRIAFIRSIDSALPGNEFPNVYSVCESLSLPIDQHEIEKLLEAMKS